MYGTRRIVLSPKAVTTTGKKLVTRAGGKTSHPMGVWYEDNGKLYADLRSDEQWYSAVNTENLGIKRFGGVSTQKELRDLIMGYCRDHKS